MKDTLKISSQYIRDEEGRMLRDPGLIFGRLARLFGTLLNANSDKFRPDIIEGLSQWSVAYALDFESTENEVIVALMPMPNAKTGGPDQIPIEVLTHGLNHEPTVLRELHLVIKLVWHQRKVPQRWRDAVMNILHRKKDKVDCGNYRGISLLTHARRSLLNVVATRVGAYYIAKELLLEGQCGFLCRSHTSLAGARSLRSTAAHDRSNPPISRCDESLSAE